MYEKQIPAQLERKDMDVNEHEKLFNIIHRDRLKEQCLYRHLICISIQLRHLIVTCTNEDPMANCVKSLETKD